MDDPWMIQREKEGGEVRHFLHLLMIGGRLRGNLGEHWGQSKVIFNRTSEENLDIFSTLLLWSIRYRSFFILEHVLIFLEFPSTPTCHVRGGEGGGGSPATH